MKMKILVVDDEFHTCKLMAEKIRAFGFEEIEAVLCAGSGQEALCVLSETPCQILITDICMSPMDGLELVAKAKEQFPELLCILLSAFDEFNYAQQGIKLRIRDYWLKPCSGEHMQKSLREIIDEYQSSQNRSNAILNMAISEAILSGSKTVEDIFRNTPAYPGNGGYVVLWEGSFSGDINLPGFWVCKLSDGKALLACPVTDMPQNGREKLEPLLDQVCRTCGVSLLGGQVAELYRQAEFALSLKWVWTCGKMIFYESDGDIGQKTDAETKEALNKSFAATAGSVESILAWIDTKQEKKSGFAFAAYVDRIYKGLLKDITELTGKPAKSLLLRPERGWRNHLEAVLRELITAKRSQASLQKKDPIRWSVEYVSNHYGDDNLDMNLLAGMLGLNYQYFSELFHKQIGKPFSAYILEFRMKEACRLLLQGKRVSDVSEKVGYQYVHSFTRAFKRMYGISPNAFRNMNE